MAIDLKEAISILEGGDWVSMRFITADVQKGTGGQVLELVKCRIARNRQPNNTIAKPLPERGGVTGETKDPNHNYNFTRNMELPNRQVRKVHPVLITHINNIAIL